MPPPLPPGPLGSFLLAPPTADEKSATTATTEIEVFLDLICPFSGKMYKTLYEDVLPALKDGETKNISIKIHQLVQPWHPQSTMVHETAFAIREVLGVEKYLQFLQLVWGEKKEFCSDGLTWNKSRLEIYDTLLDETLPALSGSLELPEETNERILALSEIRALLYPDHLLSSNNDENRKLHRMTTSSMSEITEGNVTSSETDYRRSLSSSGSAIDKDTSLVRSERHDTPIANESSIIHPNTTPIASLRDFKDDKSVAAAVAAATKKSNALRATNSRSSGITQKIKWACKHHRARGVHVTPTVFVNGIEATQISSGWTVDDWMGLFREL